MKTYFLYLFLFAEYLEKLLDLEQSFKRYNHKLQFESVNQYWLYTRKNPTDGKQIIYGDVKSIAESNFDINKITIFIAHGWYSNYKRLVNVDLTEAFLKEGDVNVICLDWSLYSRTGYLTATLAVTKVGSDLGDLIRWLSDLGLSYEKVHLVGNSLGAHVVGYAGRRTGGLVKRITALDPAGPLWTKNINRLARTDACYVECIHTNTLFFGLTPPVGHADFYPNGGRMMPGCGINSICSHHMGFKYFASTIVNPDKFMAKECGSIEGVLSDRCGGVTVPMGNNDLNKSISGIYRLNTRRHYYPYF